jgi:hypothetical protein
VGVRRGQCLGAVEFERGGAVHRPVEEEDLERDVGLEVGLAEEGDDLPPGDGLDRLAVLALIRRWKAVNPSCRTASISPTVSGAGSSLTVRRSTADRLCINVRRPMLVRFCQFPASR